ncbi:TPA: hypothetical protein HA225_03620 [Candidatus Micrarchaeota archaeon]|nr:hypothetical protein [Candidatus Micrarchaeota archaeon]HIH30066.1 hypothetical protein [Candidatus Micrarchaeota archaeon]
MQPLHPREARWFFQWDRWELVRGTGLSLIAIGMAFFAAYALGILLILPSGCASISFFGLLLFLLSVSVDNLGRPHEARKIRCRSCRSVITMGKAIGNGWACGKCGTTGKFDNLN